MKRVLIFLCAAASAFAQLTPPLVTARSEVARTTSNPVDFALIPWVGSSGELVTAASLLANTVGTFTGWSWSISRTPLQHTRYVPGSVVRRTPLSIGGVIYDGAAANQIQFNLTAALAIGSTPLYEIYTATPPAGITSLVVTGLTQFAAVIGNNDVSFDVAQLATTNGAHAGVQYHTTPTGSVQELRIETNGGVGATRRGKNISVPSTSTWYSWGVLMSNALDYGLFYLVDNSTGLCIGSSGYADSFGTDLNYIQISSYLLLGAGASGGGTITHGAWGVSSSNLAFPPEPMTIPQPTVATSQTAADAAVVSYSAVTQQVNIERSTDGGANWSVLQTAYDPVGTGTQAYNDTGLTDGNTYFYRVTAVVGSVASVVSSSASITIDNSVVPVAADTFLSYANATDLDSTANWVQRGSYTFTVYKPASTAQIYCGGSSDISSAVYFVGTWSANQAAEVEVTTVTAGSVATWMGPAVRIQSGADTYYRLVFKMNGTDQVSLQKVVAGVTSVIGANTTNLTMAVGEKLRLDVSGAGAAARLVAQRYTAGAWASLFDSVATPIDPGTYIDGGNFGMAADTSFGGDAFNGIMVSNFKGYEP